MPRISTLVPRTAYDAHVALDGRGRRSLDTRTRLERVAGGGVNLIYRTSYGPASIVEYFRDGRVRMTPVVEFSTGEFSRIAAALPPEWTARWRGNRRPQIVFRNVYPLPWVATTFHPVGDISFGRERSRLTLDELNAEADVREGVHPLPSRRRNPRPLPRYLVRTATAPAPATRGTDEFVRRWLEDRERQRIMDALASLPPEPTGTDADLRTHPRRIMEPVTVGPGEPVTRTLSMQGVTQYSTAVDWLTLTVSEEVD